MSEDGDLRAVIRRLASGASVDWNAVNDQQADDATRGLLRSLRTVSTIAEVHGTIQTVSPHTELSRTPVRARDERNEENTMWGSLALLERIGHGAHGDVYRAWDPRLDREVALKLLRHTGHEADRPSVEEGRMLARVRHPNVVTIYGADYLDGRAGIWMEFLDGHTLQEIVREQGPLRARSQISLDHLPRS